MGGTVQCGECCSPPPTPCLSICWLCAGAPGQGFSEVLGLNQVTGMYVGTKSRATVSANTALVQRLCNGVWSPDTGFPVPISASQINPPFTVVPDNCCACGLALVSVTDGCSVSNTCGLGCEAGIFGSPYNQLPKDWDVPIGASLTNSGWNSCSAMGSTYTVSGGPCSWQYSQGIGIIMPGQRCGYEQPCGNFATPTCQPSQNCVACPTDPNNSCCLPNLTTCAPCDPVQCVPVGTPGVGTGSGSCSIYIQLNFIVGTCGGHFEMTIDFGCTGSTFPPSDSNPSRTDCRGHATYASGFYPAISAVPTSVTLTGGGGTGPACNGSMPVSITITAA